MVQAIYPFIKVCSGIPYLAYTDNGTAQVVVKRCMNNAWEAVGDPFPSYVNVRCGLTMDNGIVFLAYNDRSFGGLITVVKLVNTTWTLVGGAGFSTGGSALSLYVYNGRPYVVYKDDNVLNARGTLMRFNGTTWEYKGLYSLAHADTSSLFIYKGTPYVGFNDVVAPTASTAAMAILDF